ncbi:MAG: beta-ketoacyl synthase [Bacteroidetes bacterium]|nr:beta-ketoacyl synthase [Bacteroidota bacterium]
MPEVFTSYNNIISPLGFTTKDNYSALLNNQSGIQNKSFGKLNDLFCLATIQEEKIKEFAVKAGIESGFTKLESLSILSIQDVLNQSGISLKEKNTLLIYSTTKGNIDLLEYNKPPVSKERAYLSKMTEAIGNYFGAANTPLVISNACISGLLAIIIAKRMIAEGLYENIIVCGGDLVTEFTVSGFKSFNALSTNLCKPFDARRDGINLGEAVSTILITNNKSLLSESSTHILNGASANDANHISGPSRNGDGLLQAIENTFSKHKHILPDTINAHGTATPYNDEMESIAFERAGLTHVPVNSLKGYYGHTLGAAGVLETVIALEAAHHNQLIKSAGFSEHGVSGKISVINEHKKTTINTVLKTASGFGGCNAAALFAKL